MDITLVTSSYDKVVHGTENERKTGCGINLLRPENVTRFHRTSRMTDLKEITCERCKASLAKKLIRADKKEMSLLLKEEKRREKMGITDAGIVPLGNTTARITQDPEAKRKEEEARQRAAQEARKAAEEARRAAEEAAAQEAAQSEAMNAPYDYQSAPETPPRNTIPGTGVEIDASLAQFAINVPQEEAEVAPVPVGEDDFLAQFAIQKPDAEVIPAHTGTAVQEDDFLAQFAIPSPSSADGLDSIQDYVDEPEEMDGLDMNEAPIYGQPVYGQPVYGQPSNEQLNGDMMQMYSMDDAAADEIPYGNVPYGEPVYLQQPLYDMEQPVTDAEPVQQYVSGYPAAEGMSEDLTQGNEWDYSANNLYISEDDAELGGDEPVPAYPVYDGNQPKEMEDLDIPVLDDITIPQNTGITAAERESVPVIDDISMAEETAAPVIGDITAAERTTAPVIDDISAPGNIPFPAYSGIPDTSQAYGAEPSVPDVAASVPDEEPAPIFNQPYMAEEEYDTDMSDYNYVAPGAGAENNTAGTEAEQPRQPKPQAQPQVIKVPQFAGYDANNQPVYKYVQMRLAGVDKNGQPVYVPLQSQAAAQPQPRQAQPTAAAPAQQTAAQAQRAAAPAAPAPVKSIVPKKPVQQGGVPTANISKIAVNPHSKSTSQAFINAIASSKEYADKNLIETQGLKANSPVLSSVEAVLSSMGDEKAKQFMQEQAQTKAMEKAIPAFEEYKAPQNNNTYRPRAAAPQHPAATDMRYMTKSELKAKKKQDKIDAKFRKEMSKKGF